MFQSFVCQDRRCNARVRWCERLMPSAPAPARRVDVSVRPESESDQYQPQQFAVLLNHLWATRLAPSGRPYTMTEVSKGTGLSLPYLSFLRKGTINAVPFQRVAVLADFFQVPLDYFHQKGPPVDHI